MMILKLANLFFILLITLVAFAGCERTQIITTDVTSATDPHISNMEAIPVKVVWFINFSEGGKAAYDIWVASNAETFWAPELVRSKVYDNVDPEQRPHRYVEMEFASYLDAATYMNRPEIAAILLEATDYVSDQSVHTFIRRSDDRKHEAGDWKIKHVQLMDYPLGGKQTYLDWVESVAPAVQAPPPLKAVETYDNYYGVSPHRLVTLEFASVAEADAYLSLDARKAFDVELVNRVHSIVVHRFELRAAYVKEE